MNNSHREWSYERGQVIKALQAIQYRRVTLGEFISHLLPINNLDDINQHLSKIISVDFLDSIKTVDAKFEQLLLNSVDAVIGDVIKGVNDIFNMRHVFCHELALRERAEIEIIQQAYMMMKAFLCRSSRFLDSVEHPIDDGEVMCQRELNQKANDDFLALEDQLNRLIEQIHDRDKKQLEEGYNDRVHPSDEESLRKDIEDVHVAFMNYREISARYDARDWIGGSGYPMVYFGTLSELTKQMLDELKRSREMEDNFRLLRQYCW